VIETTSIVFLSFKIGKILEKQNLFFKEGEAVFGCGDDKENFIEN
jgi:hypothetical protein